MSNNLYYYIVIAIVFKQLVQLAIYYKIIIDIIISVIIRINLVLK